jgi:death on curing protein
MAATATGSPLRQLESWTCTPRLSDASVSDDEIEYLDVEDLVDLARMLLGNPPPIRDVGLLGAAAARPQTTVFGEDAYPDIWVKAAALLQSVVKNHPLIDGNKRLGWLSTAVFLELNGVPTHRASNDDVYEFRSPRRFECWRADPYGSITSANGRNQSRGWRLAKR